MALIRIDYHATPVPRRSADSVSKDNASDQEYPSPIEEERAARRRHMLRPATFTVPGTLLLIYAAYTWIWPNYTGPILLAERLAFAFQCIFFAMLPLTMGLIVTVFKRMSDGAHDPAAGLDSKHLRVQHRINRSTLEHFIWFSISVIAVSTRLEPTEMRILPILTGVFIAARVLYWCTYALFGAKHRAPAGQITLTVNVGLFLGTVLIFALRGVS
jgi:uncharacterized MAPEG superfamily protein